MTVIKGHQKKLSARPRSGGRTAVNVALITETFDASQPLADARREKFCQFVTGGIKNGAPMSGTKAAVAAGYSEAGAGRQSVRLLNSGDIAARVTWLKTQAADKSILTRREALKMLTAQARRMVKADGTPASIVDFVEMKGGEAKVQDFGPDTPGAGAVTEVETRVAIEVGEAGPTPMKVTKVKTGSVVEVIQALAKLEGWNAAEKVKLEGDGKAAPIVRVEFVEATKADVQKVKGND